jgi:ParB family transcriptional regulator, chromosome partitioning protein
MTRRPLGRGLDALIEDTRAEPEGRGGTALQGGAGLIAVAIDRIVPGPFQPRQRFDPERLQELTRAIQTQGVIEPLIVRLVAAGAETGLRYELIAGERRLRAARNASLTEVPVIVRELDDRAALEMSLVENLAREDLNAIEEARAFVRLGAEFSLSHEEIASRIGKSRPYVSNTVRLLDLAPAVVEMLTSGQLSAGQARPLLALPSAEGQVEAARQIAEGRISARGAEQIAKTHRIRGRSGPRMSLDANLTALEEGLQRALMRKVRIVHRRGRTPGRIEIEYYDDDDLTALTSTLSGHVRTAAMSAS